MFILKRLVIMVQFLTTIPLRINLDFDNKDMGKGLAFAPFVGLIIGGLLALLHIGIGNIFPPVVTAVFLVVAYMVLTGGLHFDGLGDTFDGVFSNRSREKILEIMHDSRIGTIAALAITSVVLIYISFLMSFNSAIMIPILLFMPVTGRIGCLIGAGISKYARSDESLGKPFIDYCGKHEILIGLLIYMAVFYFIFGYKYIALSALPVLTALALTKYFTGKIGGVTGDVLGAICELNQVFFLISIYLYQKYFF